MMRAGPRHLRSGRPRVSRTVERPSTRGVANGGTNATIPEPAKREAARTTRKANGRKATPKSLATRIHILASAAKIFASHGYGLTRLADIANAAGLHLTALYYYYDNKEALANDLLTYASERNSKALQDALEEIPEGSSWRTRIEAGIRAHVASILRQDDFMRAYMAIVSQVTPEVRERALQDARRDSETWRTLIEEAAQAGEIRADVDLTMMRMTLLGAMNWSVEWFDSARGDPGRLSRAICALLFADMVPERESSCES